MAERNSGRPADDTSDQVFLDSLTPSGGVDEVELDPSELEGDEGRRGDTRGGREPERGREERPRRGERDLNAENSNLRKALHDARTRGRRLRDQVEQERARRDEEARRATAERNGSMRDEDKERLTNAETVADAAPVLLDMADRRAQGQFLDVKRGLAILSQEIARSRHSDYDDVLEESGLKESLALDANGRPRDPDVWERIYLRSDNPGEDAYAIALSMVEEKEGREPRRGDGYEELPPATGSRAEGRMDVMRTLETTTARPRGIRDLPPAGGQQRRRLTLNDIDKMSREERAKLPEHVLAAWLGKPPD